MRTRGLTLIELLAMIILLGTVAAMTVGRLSSATDAAHQQHVRASIRSADTRARMIAIRNGPTQMSVSGTGLRIAGPDDESVFSVSLPGKESLHLRSDSDQPLVMYRRDGTCATFTVEYRSGSNRASWRVDGLTGQIVAAPSGAHLK